MKTTLVLSMLCLAASGLGRAQTGFSYGREYRYPTEFNVRQNTPPANGNPGGAGPNRASLPSVEPSEFQTRKTGTAVEVKAIAVTGKVRVARGPDGKEIAELQPTNGPALRVATGSVFRWNGHLLKAVGWKDGQYLIYNLSSRKTYAFRKI